MITYIEPNARLSPILMSLITLISFILSILLSSVYILICSIIMLCYVLVSIELKKRLFKLNTKINQIVKTIDSMEENDDIIKNLEVIITKVMNLRSNKGEWYFITESIVILEIFEKQHNLV